MVPDAPPPSGSGSGSVIHGRRRKRTGVASNPWDALFPNEAAKKKSEKIRQQELEAAIADDDAVIMAVIEEFMRIAA